MSFAIVVMILYVGFSLVTFLFYGWDKRAAKLNKHRVAEKTLHWLAFLGGWPGAILAQKQFRHKTVKVRFRRFFWLTCVANVLLLVAISFFVQVGFVQGIKRILGWF